MALWRVHVQLEDRPGALGALATAVGEGGGNILSLHVVGEPADDGSVTDELLVRLGTDDDAAGLAAAVDRAGIPCTLVVRADAAELADPATTALALARMVAADPGSAPRAAATLLRARLVDPDATPHPDHVHVLRVGARELHLGRAWPVTATELSRAAALLELAAQLELRPTAEPGRVHVLHDGSEIRLRAATPADTPLVAALHARCSPTTRRSRFLSPTPQLPADELAALLGGPDGEAVLAVTSDGGSAVGLATVEPAVDDPEGPDVARFGLLVEDAWHGRGLGTALLRRVGEIAGERGLAGLIGVARAADVGVTRLLRRAGLRPSAEIVDGRVHLRAALPVPTTTPTATNGTPVG